ncbi:MAG: Ppx/GppA family phosphatase [Armatimonadetes bacterium]|nr:Ppx/GppA family phosphatase [Armatimonadota bacterium]
MRLAAIDIGTNSTKMTVADAQGDGTLSVVAEDSEVTRLGEGVDAAKRLKDEAIGRTLQAVQRFAESARSQGAERVLAAGTSALRDAANGQDFIARARERARVEVEIITGDHEAELAYAAVRSDASLNLPPDALLLVFDIGGGSTELILGQGPDVRRHKSLDAGAVRLTERFLKSDPPPDDELAQASRFADDLLETFPAPDQAPRVVGIGGTAVNLASVARALPKPDPDAVHASTLTLADVSAVLGRFRSVPLAERRQIPGLEPARADIIIGGVLLLSRLLARFHTDQFTVSARGLRFGLLAEAAKSQ